MDNEGKAPKRNTVETYRELLHIEVRALVQRVAELTTTISSVFEEVNSVAMQLEIRSQKIDQLASSAEFQRSEINELKRLRRESDDSARQLESQINDLQKTVERLEKICAEKSE